MPLSVEQMITFFGEQAGGALAGLQIAVDQADRSLATLNIGQRFKCHLMQGLIQWRHETASPVTALRAAVQSIYEGFDVLKSMPPSDLKDDLPTECASLVAYLVDLPAPPIDVAALDSDRLLVAALAEGMQGGINETLWNKGLGKLQKNKRAALAIETFTTYAKLIITPPQEADDLVRYASELFKKRARDSFYAGGDQTSGGGPDNAHTLDYFLAAVLKKIGYSGDNIHLWRWG